MKLLAIGWIVFILLFLPSCFKEETEVVTVTRADNFQIINDPNSSGYLDNQEPFSVDTDDGLVFFKEKEDEVD